MHTVLLPVLISLHIVITLCLVGLVLIQRSEGGGFVGGGGMGSFMTARTAGNAVTHLTAIFGALFMANILLIAVITGTTAKPKSILGDIPAGQEIPAPMAPAPVAPAVPAPVVPPVSQ